MVDETTAWGQLLCTTETKPPLRLIKNNIRFGRTSGKLTLIRKYLRYGQSRYMQIYALKFYCFADCDVSFLSNKYISGHHCTISRDDNGKTWVIDNR